MKDFLNRGRGGLTGKMEPTIQNPLLSPPPQGLKFQKTLIKSNQPSIIYRQKTYKSIHKMLFCEQKVLNCEQKHIIIYIFEMVEDSLHSLLSGCSRYCRAFPVSRPLAAVAQLVELLICNQRVVGSIPSGGSKLISNIRGYL